MYVTFLAHRVPPAPRVRVGCQENKEEEDHPEKMCVLILPSPLPPPTPHFPPPPPCVWGLHAASLLVFLFLSLLGEGRRCGTSGRKGRAGTAGENGTPWKECKGCMLHVVWHILRMFLSPLPLLLLPPSPSSFSLDPAGYSWYTWSEWHWWYPWDTWRERRRRRNGELSPSLCFGEVEWNFTW